jgi:hypothetical protein
MIDESLLAGAFSLLLLDKLGVFGPFGALQILRAARMGGLIPIRFQRNC